MFSCSQVRCDFRWLLPVLLASSMIAGCGDMPTVKEYPTSTGQQESDLQAALLTGGDLPPGFEARGLQEADSGSLNACPLLVDDPPGTTATASVVFGKATETVSESLYVVDRTREAMAAFAALPEVCARFEGTVLNMKLTFTTVNATPPAIGDAAVAVRITALLPGGLPALTQDVVVVSHKDIIVEVSVLTLAPAEDLVTSVVRRAVDKVLARW